MISVRCSIEHLFPVTLNVVRVYCVDTGEASEVRPVKRENLTDPVGVHGSGEPCVVNLNAGHAILHDNPSPLAVDRFGISEKRKAAFDVLGVSLCLFYCEAETVPLFRTRGSIPELGHVLQRIGWNHALLCEGTNCAAYQRKFWVIAFYETEQDVTVGQGRGTTSPSIMILIEAFARERLCGQDRNLVGVSRQLIQRSLELF